MVSPLLLAEAARQLERSDKARLLGAFLATLALGALLLLMVWALARAARRYMNQRPEPVSTPLPEQDLWRMKAEGEADGRSRNGGSDDSRSDR